MKYITYNTEFMKWEMVYCNCHEDRAETDEEIMKAITTCFYVGKFNASEHTCLSSHRIKNDGKLYILTDMDGHQYIWQLGSSVSDMTDAIIPHTYYVRKVGELIYGGEN